MKVSLNIPESLYNFSKVYAEHVGVTTEKFLYSALCHSLEKLMLKMEENWIEMETEPLVHLLGNKR